MAGEGAPAIFILSYLSVRYHYSMADGRKKRKNAFSKKSDCKYII